MMTIYTLASLAGILWFGWKAFRAKATATYAGDQAGVYLYVVLSCAVAVQFAIVGIIYLAVN